MKLKILPLILAAVIIAVPLALVDSDVQADDSGTFEVTDGTGRTFTFDGPSEHIVTCGTGVTITVADCGAVDKLVGVDKYSTYEYTGYEQLKDMHAEDLQSFYGTGNHEYIEIELLNMVSDGTMNFDDAILLTSYSANEQLRERLEGVGFTHILVWMDSDIETFSDMAQFVNDVSMIATGSISGGAAEMNENISYVESVAATIPEDEVADALIVWYSSSYGIGITNVGIASSMLDACNANNIGLKNDGSAYWGDLSDVIKLLEEHPGTVVFLNASWASAGYTVDDFKANLGSHADDYTFVQMGALWNNWCPESADGLLSMASALYPEYFGEYDGGSSGGSDDDDSLIWWAVAIIIVIIIIIILAWYLYRQRTH